MDYKDLDIVLNKLNSKIKTTDTQLEYNQYSLNQLVSENRYSEEFLRLIINKLYSDGYIEFMLKENVRYYFINFEGIEFLNKGGYNKKLELSTLNSELLKKKSKLIRVVHFSTVIVGVYYLFVFLKEFVFSFLFHH